MPGYHSFDLIGFHSCDLEVGLKLLNGQDEILPSKNDWDWLGQGSYFWEQYPIRYGKRARQAKRIKELQKRHLLSVPLLS